MTASIENDILEWAAERPEWQRNLLKRISRGETVDETYISRLANAIVAGTVTLETPELSATDLPSGSINGDTVQLVSIGKLKSVNALLEDETLSFGETGVTVIYGDNGSGKSGYARLAKDAVGARHKEKILPDAFMPLTDAQSAQITYSLGGDLKMVNWPGLLEPALNRAHFYDEACGNDYLDRDTELAYRPSVLNLLDELIVHVDAVRAAINAMILASEANALVFPVVQPGTPSEAFLKSISATTTIQDIDDALSLPDKPREVQADLVKEEARLKTTDPKKEKQRLLSAAVNLNALADHFEMLSRDLSPARGDELIATQIKAKTLRAAATTVSRSSFADEPLSNVGSDIWLALWKAAENYSTAEAYPCLDFPATAEGQVCVLCQQPLQSEAQARLVRFHQFVHNDVATQAQKAEEGFKNAIRDLQETIVTTERTAGAITFLSEGDKDLGISLTTALETAKLAKTRIRERLCGESEEAWIVLQVVDTCEIRKRAADLTTKANAIDEAVFAEALTECQSKLAALESRMAIAPLRAEIGKEIQRLKSHDALEKILPEIRTQAISLMSGKLARIYVTDAVKTHFRGESENLKLAHVVLGDGGVLKGKVRHKPSLLGASDSSPKAVLSEGEQTATGLAGFFTEIEFDTTKSAVILDDPMSSLDHERRKNAAFRLVKIAETRQVIVFTHDLIFLGEIVKAAEEFGVSLTERAIERNGEQRPGRVIEGYPWKARDARKRIGDLGSELDQLAKNQSGISAEDYERLASDWAGKLSETWERIVRSEIAFRLVDRGTTEVRAKMFRIAAQITDTDNTEFQAGYSVSSEWARRHDKSEERNFVPPSIDEMRGELERIESWWKRVKKYAE